MSRPTLFLACALALVACDDVAEAIDDYEDSTPGEADGRAVKLAEGSNRFSTVASDGQTIFVVQLNGEVYTHPKDGGAMTKIGDLKRVIDAWEERALVDNDSLWVVGPKGLFKLPKTGGDVVKVSVGIDGGETIGIAQNDGFVFVVGDPTESGTDRQKQVLKIDKKTLKAEPLGQRWQRVGGLVGDGTNLFLTDIDAGSVVRLPMDGSESKVLASEMPHPEEIGLGPEHVYWKNNVDLDRKDIGSKLARIKKDGSGAMETLWDSGATGTLYADAQFVYACGASAVIRAPVASAHAPGQPDTAIAKFLDITCADMVLLDDRIVAVENSGNALSDKGRNKPNRVLSATK